MNLFDTYNLIGLGEFSHGIRESWDFRFNLLKMALKMTDKHIFVFNEMSIWQGDNIMNHTIVNPENEVFSKYDKIKIEKPVRKSKSSSWGKLWQYVSHASESKIFLKITKFIRKNSDRITIVGIDNDDLSRDYDMYKNIMKQLDNKNINFFWAHNSHIDNRKLSQTDYKWTKKSFPKLKYCCGYYLKKKLGDKYCIILSQSYRGANRFNSYCDGNACSIRTWRLKYFYKKFRYDQNKKYVNPKKQFQLLDKFDNKLMEFSNSYFKKNKYGYQELITSKTWDYILFWNTVSYLEPYCKY